jgi:hypothetical protein
MMKAAQAVMLAADGSGEDGDDSSGEDGDDSSGDEWAAGVQMALLALAPAAPCIKVNRAARLRQERQAQAQARARQRAELQAQQLELQPAPAQQLELERQEPALQLQPARPPANKLERGRGGEAPPAARRKSTRQAAVAATAWLENIKQQEAGELLLPAAGGV